MKLEISELRAGYGRIEVLHGLSIEVPRGAPVGLFGPNGHGKTTLLRTISGLLPASEGTITFEGRDIANASPDAVVRAGVLHVAQASTLFPTMNVLEALTLGAYSTHAWPRRKDSLETVFDIFPRLAERRGQNCNTLSGGERQMAAIGVGLMGCPKLLMLDEPTLGLAPKVRFELGERIGRIAESGTDLIVVDQDVELLLNLCTRLYLIEKGTVSMQINDRSELQHGDVMRRYFGDAA